MKTPLEVLHKYFHHFKSERTRDLVVKAMEDYANIYHESEVKKLNMLALQHSDDMCFHEYPDCNCRCNCSDQPCSCCNEA